MTDEELREAWVRFRDEANEDAVGSKQVTDAFFALAAAYGNLAADEQLVIDQLLAEQLLSDDQSVRGDSLSLIQEFRISSTLPQLHLLVDRLELDPGPGAPYERAEVLGLIRDFSRLSDQAG